MTFSRAEIRSLQPKIPYPYLVFVNFCSFNTIWFTPILRSLVRIHRQCVTEWAKVFFPLIQQIHLSQHILKLIKASNFGKKMKTHQLNAMMPIWMKEKRVYARLLLEFWFDEWQFIFDCPITKHRVDILWCLLNYLWFILIDEESEWLIKTSLRKKRVKPFCENRPKIICKFKV